MTLKPDYMNLLRIAKSKKKPTLMDMDGRSIRTVSVNAKGMVRVVFCEGADKTFTQTVADKVLVKVYDRAEREASLDDCEAEIKHPARWAAPFIDEVTSESDSVGA